MKALLMAAGICLSLFAQAQEVVGKWKTIDDNTGKAKSIVEIYKQGDKYYGKVLELFRGPGEDQNPICEECDEDDARYKKPVKGMVILQDMEYDAKDKTLEDGKILDPENGETYDCKMWVGEDGNLNVRGYVAFFYRTQQWLPYKG
jgi:uncharacterized protein (DUF2147 family)